MAELPPQKRKAELNATVGLTDADEAKLRALLSTPFDGAAPKKKKEFLATVAVVDTDVDAVGETARMSVPEGLAAAAAARDALPFPKVAPPPAPHPHPTVAAHRAETADKLRLPSQWV